MKRIYWVLVALLFASCQQKERADLILRNGKIYTVNNNFSVLQSVAIRDGKFVAVSSDANIRTRYYSDSVIDLKGNFVYPAFIDAHSNFVDYALSLSDTIITQPSDNQLSELLKKAENNCFSMGITSVTDFGTSYSNLQLIDSLQKNNLLNINIYCILEPSAENIKNYLNKVPYYTEKLKAIAVGFNLDGDLATHNAVLLSPYADNQNAQMLVDTETLYNLCQTAYNQGFQICVGCSGDSAARVAFKTFAKILPRKNNLRWRVENLQMTNMRDLRYISHYNIIPTIIPTKYASTRETLPQLLSKKQLREVFAWKKILGQNQGIVCGMNVPDEPLNPFQTMYASMRQEKRKLQNKQGQELVATQALKSMTIWAAYAQFDENNRGSIEVGKTADFFITNENLTTMFKPYLPNVQIVSTYMKGKKVYEIGETNSAK